MERKKREELEGALSIAARELTAARGARGGSAGTATAGSEAADGVPAGGTPESSPRDSQLVAIMSASKRVAAEAQAAKTLAATEKHRRRQTEASLQAARTELESEKESRAMALAEAAAEKKRVEDLGAALQLAATELHKVRAHRHLSHFVASFVHPIPALACLPLKDSLRRFAAAEHICQSASHLWC